MSKQMKTILIIVGVVVLIGLMAFGKIIASFVKDVIMPPIGILLGGVDFTNLKYIIKEATESAEAVAISYGVFINTVIEFYQ